MLIYMQLNKKKARIIRLVYSCRAFISYTISIINGPVVAPLDINLISSARSFYYQVITEEYAND